MHAAVGKIRGWSIATPHGAMRRPLAASVPNSSRLITALRLVSPVTTASGKAVAAAAVGLGSTVGDGAVDGTEVGARVGKGVGEAVGLGFWHATSNAAIATTRVRRMAARKVTRRRDGE